MPDKSTVDVDIFHREVASFIELYAPRSGYGREFELELRMLLARSAELARRPFIYELNAYRDMAVEQAMLKPMVGIKP